jgi:hypothetical protein
VRRKWLVVWHVMLALLIMEVIFYGITACAIAYCRNSVERQWGANASVLQEIDKVPYSDLINRYSRMVGVSPRVVASVIQTESAFRPRAISSAGAVGLMQIMPDTWREINLKVGACTGRHSGECTSECYYDPELNIRIGTAYLGQLVKRYGGNITFAVAAFNAGPAAVDYYGGIPPYKETEAYVDRVRANWYDVSGIPVSGLGQRKWEQSLRITKWSILVTMIVELWVMRQLRRCFRSWRWR